MLVALMSSGPVKSGTCYANGARVDATPGAMTLEVRTDAGTLQYEVPWGSHHEAAYVAAMVALVLMDAQGYHVVEVQTPNEVVVEQMNGAWEVGADHLLSPYFSLMHMRGMFKRVIFTKV